MNGEGMHRFESVDAVHKFCAEGPSPPAGQYVAQTYHAGYDIDCSVLSREGQILAYTCQRGITKASDEFLPPDTIEFVHRDDVLALAERLVAALGWTGIAHIDMRYSDDVEQLLMLEVNGRFWGTVMGSMFAGINFPHLSCLAALGREFALPSYEPNVFAHVSAAARQSLPGRRRHDVRPIRWRDTPLLYSLADPLAELLRQFQQRRAR